MLAAAFMPAFLPLALLITLVGALTGPRDNLQPVLLAENAPAEHRTEVFAWLNTFMWTGYGMGTAVAGHLTAPGTDGHASFIAASAIALLGAAVAAGLHRPAALQDTRRPEVTTTTPPAVPGQPRLQASPQAAEQSTLTR